MQSRPPLSFANFAAAQYGQSHFNPGKLSPTEQASYYAPPAGVFSIVITPYQMLEGTSPQLIQPF